MSTIFISVPFMVRATFNVIKILIDFNTTFKYSSLVHNDFNYPLFLISFYLIVDIMPMFVQMLLVKFVIHHDHSELKQSSSKRLKANLSYGNNRFSTSRKGTYTNITTSIISINSYINIKLKHACYMFDKLNVIKESKSSELSELLETHHTCSSICKYWFSKFSCEFDAHITIN